MQISQRAIKDVVVLHLSGVFFEWAHQEEGRKQFLALFQELLDGGKRKFVINLADVDGIDSLGWAILLHAYKRVREKDGIFALANAGERYKPLIEALRLDRIWDHFDSEDEAVAHLASKS